MKKILSLILAFALCFSCISVIGAEESALFVKLEISDEAPSVGDVVTVNVTLNNNTSKKLVAYDVAIFYNSDVLEYVAEDGIKVDPKLSEAGIAPIYTKAEESLVRMAAAFTPDTIDKIPAEVEENAVICTLKFKAIAEGDTKLAFAVENATPVFSKSLPEGAMVFAEDSTTASDIKLENPALIIGEGKAVKMITEIAEIDKIEVPVGTTVEDVISMLPSDVTVKLDDGTEGTVKMTWMAGSLVSGYDATTPGEYLFTGNISDSGEYINYNKLFSMATVAVTGSADSEIEDDSIKVIVNGKNVEFDVAPTIINDRTMVPLRAIFEALGADVDWDDATKTITAVKDDTTITMQIGNTVMTKNGEEITLDSEPTIIDSRTLVPVRAIAESFGSDVSWEAETKTVIIKDLEPVEDTATDEAEIEEDSEKAEGAEDSEDIADDETKADAENSDSENTEDTAEETEE